MFLFSLLVPHDTIIESVVLQFLMASFVFSIATASYIVDNAVTASVKVMNVCSSLDLWLW